MKDDEGQLHKSDMYCIYVTLDHNCRKAYHYYTRFHTLFHKPSVRPSCSATDGAYACESSGAESSGRDAEEIQ